MAAFFLLLGMLRLVGCLLIGFVLVTSLSRSLASFCEALASGDGERHYRTHKNLTAIAAVQLLEPCTTFEPTDSLPRRQLSGASMLSNSCSCWMEILYGYFQLFLLCWSLILIISISSRFNFDGLGCYDP